MLTKIKTHTNKTYSTITFFRLFFSKLTQNLSNLCSSVLIMFIFSHSSEGGEIREARSSPEESRGAKGVRPGRGPRVGRRPHRASGAATIAQLQQHPVHVWRRRRPQISSPEAALQGRAQGGAAAAQGARPHPRAVQPGEGGRRGRSSGARAVGERARPHRPPTPSL